MSGKSSSPTLRPGDIVIMDNLGSHKAKAVRQLIRSRDQALLPAKILAGPEPDRTGLRQAQALVAQGRRVTIGEILRAITPTQCANYFRNSGYAQS